MGWVRIDALNETLDNIHYCWNEWSAAKHGSIFLAFPLACKREQTFVLKPANWRFERVDRLQMQKLPWRCLTSIPMTWSSRES